MDTKGESMKLNKLIEAINLKKYPELVDNSDFKDLTVSTKARIDEFQKKFKEYNKDYLDKMDDDSTRDAVKSLSESGLRAIDDKKMDIVVDLLSPMIGEGTTLVKRIENTNTEGLYDALISEVMMSLQSLATREYIDTTNVPDTFGDEYFGELMAEYIEKIIAQLENMADALATMPPKKANIIATNRDNRQVFERIDQISLQTALLKASLD